MKGQPLKFPKSAPDSVEMLFNKNSLEHCCSLLYLCFIYVVLNILLNEYFDAIK